MALMPIDVHDPAPKPAADLDLVVRVELLEAALAEMQRYFATVGTIMSMVPNLLCTQEEQTAPHPESR